MAWQVELLGKGRRYRLTNSAYSVMVDIKHVARVHLDNQLQP